MHLPGVGIWTAQFDFHPAPRALAAVREIESLGYTALWVGENVGREPFTQAALMLTATHHMIVGTGVASIWARDPLATLAAHYTLAEAHPDRFILGLGVSHPQLAHARGHQYTTPVTAMSDYLDAMDQASTRYRAIHPEHTRRVLAALGPHMLRLAAQRTDGAHTYLVPPAHTAHARAILGPEKLLIVEQAVVVESDPRTARHIARQHLRRYLPLTNYTNNLRRLGYTDHDLTSPGSVRLVDDLVAWGEPTTIHRRIAEHTHAGSNHVCLQILTPDKHELPRQQWQVIATAPPTE